MSIADPTHPVTVGQTGVLSSCCVGCGGFWYYAYLANGDAGLQIIDVSEPI